MNAAISDATTSPNRKVRGMDMIAEIAATVLAQMQKPTLAFLIGGMVLAALGGVVQPQGFLQFRPQIEHKEQDS